MAGPSSWLADPLDPGTVLFGFLRVTGALTKSAQTFEEVIRPGVDGVGVWYTGSRGQPFALQTVSDFASDAAAKTVFDVYLSWKGQVLKLTHHEVFFSDVLVRDVTLREVRRISAAVNGIQLAAGTSGVAMVADWDLRPIA